MLFSILFLCIFLLKVSAKVTFEDLKIDFDKNYVEVIQNIKKDEGRVLINIDTTVKQEITDNAYVAASLSALIDGEYMPMLKLEPLPFCKFLNMENKPSILKIALMLVKSLGDLPEECPIKKGNYNIRDLEIDESFVIPFAPSGTIKIEFFVYLKEGGKLKQITQSACKVIVDQPEE